MMNDNELIKKRLFELSRRSYERGYTVYSDFLSIDEAGILFEQNTMHRLIFSADTKTQRERLRLLAMRRIATLSSA